MGPWVKLQLSQTAWFDAESAVVVLVIYWTIVPFRDWIKIEVFWISTCSIRWRTKPDRVARRPNWVFHQYSDSMWCNSINCAPRGWLPCLGCLGEDHVHLVGIILQHVLLYCWPTRILHTVLDTPSFQLPAAPNHHFYDGLFRPIHWLIIMFPYFPQKIPPYFQTLPQQHEASVVEIMMATRLPCIQLT